MGGVLVVGANICFTIQDMSLHLVNGSLVGVPFIETLVTRLTIITLVHSQCKGRISKCTYRTSENVVSGRLKMSVSENAFRG